MVSATKILDAVLEVPPKNEPQKDKRQDRVTDILFCLILFGFAMWWRFFVYSWFFANYSDGFNIVLNAGDWLANVFGVSITEGGSYEVPSEGFADLPVYYYPYVENFANGWNPYVGSLDPGDSIGGYVYGPFYIFFISLGRIFLGMSPHDSVMYSNFIFDALTSVMIYILAKRYTGNVTAALIALVYNFSPVVLFYFNIKLLNTPHMSFFVLIAIWCFLEHRDTWAIFFIAFSALIKQFPLLFAMPVLLFLIRRYGIMKAIIFFFKLLLFFVILSFPYLILTPNQYIARLLIAGGPKSRILTLDEAILGINRGETANLAYAPLVTAGEIDGTYDGGILQAILFPLVNSHLLFFGSLFVLSWFAFGAYRHLETNPHLYLRFFAGYQFIAHGAIARGIYKYYDAFLMCFLILAFVPATSSNLMNIQIGKTIKRGFKTVFDPKYKNQKPTFHYWALFIFAILATVSCFFIGYWAITLFTGREDQMRPLWAIGLAILLIFAIATSSVQRLTKKPSATKDALEAKRAQKISATQSMKKTENSETQESIETLKVNNPDLKDPSGKMNPSSFLSSKIATITNTIPPIVIDVVLWGLSIALLLLVYFVIMQVIVAEPGGIFSSSALVVFSLFAGIPAVARTLRQSDKVKIFLLSGIIGTFMLLRLFIFNSEEPFAKYNTDAFSFGLFSLNVISLGLSFAIVDVFRFFAQLLYDVYSNPKQKLAIMKKSESSVKDGLTFSLLLFVITLAFFLVDTFAELFFAQNLQAYAGYIFAIIGIVSIFWFLHDIEFLVRKEGKSPLINFEIRSFFFSFGFLIINFVIFWNINVWILTAHRLLGPAVIFIVGIFIVGTLTQEFWRQGYSYTLSLYGKFRSVLS